jgi:hypothetical protein
MTAATTEVSRFNAENATSLATDFLKRLGYKKGLRATKVSLAEEIYVVEMVLEGRTAKVNIDFNTKEVKEYEIQEAEENSGFSFDKWKRPLLLVAVIGAVIVVLKLVNLF